MDKKKIWAQAYALYKQGVGVFNYNLIAEEFAEAEKMNQEHRLDEPERDLILTYFKRCRRGEGEFMSATKILKIIQSKSEPGTARYSYPVTIGKTLSSLGFRQDTRRLPGYPHARHGWWVLYTGISPYLNIIDNTIPIKEDNARELGNEG